MKKFILLLLLLSIPFIASAQVASVPHSFSRDACVLIREEDGSPANFGCLPVGVPNGTLTDNGDGTFSLSTGGAPEGTAVLSTGEGGGTKYLREDGDGTCSWQTPAGAGDLLADGTVPLTANWDVGNFDLTFKSATGDGTIEGAILTEGGNAVWNDTETDIIKDTHPDFGTGANQISASDMPDEDLGDITVVSGVYSVDAGSIHDLTINVKEENTSAIVKGQSVYVSGAAGAGQTLVGLIDNTDSTKIRALGLAAEDIAQNATGTVRLRGEISGVDTLGANAVNPNDEAWAAGDILYCTNGGLDGGLTNVKPTSGRIIRAGYSLIGSHNSDTILVQPHESSICLATASGEDICVRMGDNGGVNKTCFRDYANNIVACVDSNGVFTSTGLTIGSAAILEAELEILDGATLTTIELNYVDGVTSAIQGQIDGKEAALTTLAALSTALSNQAEVQVAFVITNGDTAISAAVTDPIVCTSRIPNNLKITAWYLDCDQSGSIVLDVWKNTWNDTPLVNGDSIAGTEKPTLSADVSASDTSLSSMTADWDAGEQVCIEIESAATVTKCNLSFYGYPD